MSLSLTAGVEYTFQIIATNAAGTAVIGTTTGLTPFTTPGAPTLGTVTAGNLTASVVLTAPGASNGNAITNYQYGIGTTATPPTAFTPFVPDIKTSPLTIPLPTNGTLYYIWVKAVNAAGPGLISNSRTATGVGPLPVINSLTSHTYNKVGSGNPGTLNITITYTSTISPGDNLISATFSYMTNTYGGYTIITSASARPTNTQANFSFYSANAIGYIPKTGFQCQFYITTNKGNSNIAFFAW